jgi:MATE family multidrug resistance protein
MLEYVRSLFVLMSKAAPLPSYAALVRFAVPVMLAGMATPLMSMVDTAVLGRLGDATVIAAAGIGGTIFSVVYWCFSFLRQTTTGLVAQAVGRGDREEILLAGMRPMLAAVAGGVSLWLLQWPIAWAAMHLLTPPAEVQPLSMQYFHARIWSAPFTLLSYAQFAWLMGQGRARAVMVLQVGMNVLNATLAVTFVLGLHWGIAGAGWATAASEISASLVTGYLMLRMVPWRDWLAAFAHAFHGPAWRKLFGANLDIMIRTLLLTGSFALITERGGQLGTQALAVNQILMQAFLAFAFLLDGFAAAAEVYGAQAFGAGSRTALKAIVGRNALLSLVWSLCLSVGLALLAHSYLALMTPNEALQHEALRYWPWVVLMPPVCIWAFLWDGVYMGTTRTRTLRDAMIASVAIYAPALFLFSHYWGNHGIWAAMNLFMAARSLMLSLAWPSLLRATEAQAA